MAKDFAAQVDAWVLKSRRRTEAVFKESAQRVIEAMQEVGPSVASPDSSGTGHMPVDTGFLRASLVTSLNSAASGVTVNDSDVKSFTYNEDETNLVILAAQIGDTIYAVYTAVYGRKMEERYGFVRLAAQQWQSIVAEVVREAKTRIQ